MDVRRSLQPNAMDSTRELWQPVPGQPALDNSCDQMTSLYSNIRLNGTIQEKNEELENKTAKVFSGTYLCPYCSVDKTPMWRPLKAYKGKIKACNSCGIMANRLFSKALDDEEFNFNSNPPVKWVNLLLVAKAFRSELDKVEKQKQNIQSFIG